MGGSEYSLSEGGERPNDFGVHFELLRTKSDQLRIPKHLKVSCQQFDNCISPSKSLTDFVCGSNFSHNDRVRGCVEYLRLERGVAQNKREGTTH